jgi:hypothetical protein
MGQNYFVMYKNKEKQECPINGLEKECPINGRFTLYKLNLNIIKQFNLVN